MRLLAPAIFGQLGVTVHFESLTQRAAIGGLMNHHPKFRAESRCSIAAYCAIQPFSASPLAINRPSALQLQIAVVQWCLTGLAPCFCQHRKSVPKALAPTLGRAGYWFEAGFVFHASVRQADPWAAQAGPQSLARAASLDLVACWLQAPFHCVQSNQSNR